MLWMLACAALLLTAIYWRVRPGWRITGPFLPDACLLGVLIYAAGITWLIAFEPAPHQQQVAAMAWMALASTAAGATIFCLTAARRQRGTFSEYVAAARSGRLERAVIGAGLIASIAACVVFVSLVLRTDAIAALLGIGSLATDVDLLRARVLISSGSEVWLAPGYFKQFRDILLPVLLAAMVIHDRRCLSRAWFWVAAIAGLGAVLISGQRLVVVVFLATLAMAAHYATASGRRAPTPRQRSRAPWIAAGAVALGYGALTFLLGRVRDVAEGGGLTSAILRNLLDRVFLAAPRENALTYPVWSETGPSLGLSWLRDLAGMLPGADQALSNVLHMASGGSALGNSPLGLAPDVWLAWGWPGLLIVPGLIAILAGLLDFACRMRRSPVLIGLQLYLFLVLPVCYSPFMFLLYGGVVAALLLVLIFAVRRPARASAAPGHG